MPSKSKIAAFILINAICFHSHSALAVACPVSAPVNDADGDGYDDSFDIFPNDITEWYDTDLDGIGNNADTDDDGDGIADNIDDNNDGDPVVDFHDPFPEDATRWLDFDGDCLDDNEDTDDDNDGTLDIFDAFPLNASEFEDTDSDGIGDIADNDDDDDGVIDIYDDLPKDPLEQVDTDSDGIGNNADPDDDNDGVLDANDAFPLDNLESVDLDGDGLGDNADSDNDGDGFADAIDVFRDNPDEWLDSDSDGVGNNADFDDDNDTVLDADDAFPLDPNESVDTDGDSIGNNADNDDDNDGIADGNDAFPLDANEYLDTDGDGIGNNADTDDDGDGYLDGDDAFPLRASEYIDTDGDGRGNNEDEDDDGDGILDVNDPEPLDMLRTTDTDGDGIANIDDLDDDGDGVNDANDLFPLDPNETDDFDRDGLGNNADADDDNDGVIDSNDDFVFDSSEWLDTDNDGLGNNADNDDDNDGYIDSDDIFPLNNLEWYDFDGDGVGDNADADDDNDGVLDSSDVFPFDNSEWVDTDGDGQGNNIDIDDDNDSYLDSEDLFPLNNLEWHDNDIDGIGNNADSDDDNDGVLDDEDAFPFDATEYLDTDGDGIGNVNDIDDDNDGYLDFIDELPLNPNEAFDADDDGLGDNADPDDDNDGMSDEFEILYGLNPRNATDATLDSDGDGVLNHEEQINHTNPLVDDYPPELTTPVAININAEHTYTQLTLDKLLSLTQITAYDGKDGPNCCEILPLGFENGVANFQSGENLITWRTEDLAGNIATVEQAVNFAPLVSFAKQQFSAEGSFVKIQVELSGESPKYPLEIPFSISGDVDSFDYQVDEQKVVIESGVSGYVELYLRQDNQQEGQEELIVTFSASVNSANNKQHTIFISEDNIAPLSTISVFQQGEQVSSIVKDLGEAHILLSIDDANTTDKHIVSWDIPDFVNAEISANQLSVYIDPEAVVLPEDAHQLISFSVTITDSGTGELSQQQFIDLALFEQRARLDSTDTDLDGIPDNIEGFTDLDGDGIPAFMDNSTIAYMQPLHVNAAQTKIIETEPGLRLGLGKFAKLQFSDGVQLSALEVENTQLISADDLTHIGGYFDFIIDKIVPFGRSVSVTIPLTEEIPSNAVYRKYSIENGWQNFVEDSENSISSSPLVNGVCPFADNTSYQSGLNEGDVCIRLTIEDGGVNDADGVANGVIDDPGVVALIPNSEVAKTVDPEKSSSGGVVYVLVLLLLTAFVHRAKHLLCSINRI